MTKRMTMESGLSSWEDAVRRWQVRCPACTQAWLVVGAMANDPYICKSCGHRFVVTLRVAPKGA